MCTNFLANEFRDIDYSFNSAKIGDSKSWVKGRTTGIRKKLMEQEMILILMIRMVLVNSLFNINIILKVNLISLEE